MRILVIGASGFIGRYVMRRLGASPDHDVSGTYWSRPAADDGNTWHQVELTDTPALERLFERVRPHLVIHLAAMADVGTAEREPERATAVNVAATATIARLCEQHGSRLIFVSTEYVYDGEGGPYREDRTPGPNTHYGRTKWEAEQEVAWETEAWSIVRTSIVYGWPEPGQRNFAPWLIENLRNGRPYLAPADVMRTPVYVEHLVDGIARMVGLDCPGILHIAGRDWVSMHEFAAAIANAFDLDANLVQPMDADTQARAGASTRPDRLGLDCRETMRRLNLEHPGLAEGIAALKADAPSL